MAKSKGLDYLKCISLLIKMKDLDEEINKFKNAGSKDANKNWLKYNLGRAKTRHHKELIKVLGPAKEEKLVRSKAS